MEEAEPSLRRLLIAGLGLQESDAEECLIQGVEVFVERNYGRAVADVLVGRAGADTLNGGAGNDRLDGGVGLNTAVFSGQRTSCTMVAHMDGTLTVTGLDGIDLLRNVQFAQFSDQPVDLSTIKPAAPSLILRGTSRADRLVGKDGDDQLWGGSGKDTLTGGLGHDAFVFDTKPSKTRNMDTITDFHVADDSIWLENKVFKKLGKGSEAHPGKLNKKFFVVGSKAEDKNDYLVYDNKKGILYCDADGSGRSKAVEIVKLSKNPKLTTANFFVI